MFQDRIIKDMAFHGITEIEAGNQWLKEKFLNDLNARFAHSPASNVEMHQSLLPGCELGNIFVWEEKWTVQGDWLVRWNNRWFQLLGKSTTLPHAKGGVLVQERLDGGVRIVYRGKELQYKEVEKAERKRLPKENVEKKEAFGKKPGPNHPWRKTDFRNIKKRLQEKIKMAESAVANPERSAG